MLPRKAASAEDATLACTRDTEKHERSESVWGPNNEISGGILLFFFVHCTLSVCISSLPAHKYRYHVRYATVDVCNFGSFEFP